MKNTVFIYIFLFIVSNSALFAQNSNCTNPTNTFTNGTIISFDQVKYDFPAEGQSTWFYTIDNSNGSKGASHTSFVFNECITQNEFYGGGTYTNMTQAGLNFNNSFVLGIDGSYKKAELYAMKYDVEVTKGNVSKVFFVLKKNYLSSIGDVLIKPGNNFEFGTLCTPSNSCTALPVELIDFKINYLLDAIELNWSTASEINNKGFYVEYSLDGIEFSNLAFVKSSTNSNELRHYTYKDVHNKIGYYRLRIVDLDGYTEFSKILVLDEQKQKKVKLLPNFVQNNFEVVIKNDKINSIKIVNGVGYDLTNNVELHIEANAAIVKEIMLSPGLYYVIINEQVIKKFVKI